MKHNRLILYAAMAFILLTGMVGCHLPTITCADTFTVTTNVDINDGSCTAEHCSLREAVIAANFCAGHQTIVVPANSYQLTLSGAEEDAAATGDLDITDDVTINGEGAPSIDGMGLDRIFENFSGTDVEINNFIIINGLAQLGGGIRSHGNLTVNDSSIHDNRSEVPPGGAGASSGGGIFIEAGATTLNNTDVFGNYSDFGGGVHNFATATFNMTGGHLTGNTASGNGGGLWNNMAATTNLQNVEIAMNTADGFGAGIYNDGTLEGTQVTFNENVSASQGGGLYNDVNGEAFLTLAWFTNNNAQLGGGLYNLGLLDLYQSSLTNNSALGGQGGGAFNDGASAGLLMQNTTVSSNMIVPFAAPGGSGIYNNGGNVSLEFSTLAYNNADGVDNHGGTVSLRNTILAYHALGNCVGSAADSQGYNLEDGDSCNFDEPTDLVDTAPLLAWLDMNGGANLSHALNPGSPAIDSGDPDRCTAIDQRGVARPQGTACDRGSYEVEAGISSPSIPTALALINANCHHGPGLEYENTTMLEQGQSYTINGRDQLSNWWRVVIPTGAFCWVSDSAVETTGEPNSVPIIDVAPVVTDVPVTEGCWIYNQAGSKQCIVPCPANPKPGGTCTP